MLNTYNALLSNDQMETNQITKRDKIKVDNSENILYVLLRVNDQKDNFPISRQGCSILFLNTCFYSPIFADPETIIITA